MSAIDIELDEQFDTDDTKNIRAASRSDLTQLRTAPDELRILRGIAEGDEYAKLFVTASDNAKRIEKSLHQFWTDIEEDTRYIGRLKDDIEKYEAYLATAQKRVKSGERVIENLLKCSDTSTSWAKRYYHEAATWLADDKDLFE